jgi:hypothetical protein
MTPLGRRPLALAALAIAVIAFAANVLGVFDPDMFHHLALGRDIVRSGLRSEDPFLFPMRGQAVGPMPYWLGSVLLYGWHVLFGDGGLAFLPSLVAAITFIILFLDTSPRSGRHTPLTLAAAALPLALAIATFRYRATARTELFAVLFVALTLWGIRRLEDGRPRALLGFPLLALVWTNVHTSVVVGAGLVGIFAAVGLAAHGAGRALGRPIPGCPSRRQIATAAAVAAAGLALSLLNPSPMNPVLSALRFAGSAVGAAGVGPEASDGLGRAMAIVRRLVDEMRPPGAAFWLGPPGLLLGLTAVSFALRWRALRWREVVTLPCSRTSPRSRSGSPSSSPSRARRSRRETSGRRSRPYRSGSAGGARAWPRAACSPAPPWPCRSRRTIRRSGPEPASASAPTRCEPSTTSRRSGSRGTCTTASPTADTSSGAGSDGSSRTAGGSFPSGRRRSA